MGAGQIIAGRIDHAQLAPCKRIEAVFGHGGAQDLLSLGEIVFIFRCDQSMAKHGCDQGVRIGELCRFAQRHKRLVRATRFEQNLPSQF